MRNSDLEGFRRAVQLRDRCRAAAVAASHHLEVPMSPVQANVAFDAMVDLIRDYDRQGAGQQVAVTRPSDSACPDEWQPAHLYGSRPDACATCWQAPQDARWDRCRRCGQEDIDGVRWVDMVDECVADVCPVRDGVVTRPNPSETLS